MPMTSTCLYDDAVENSIERLKKITIDDSFSLRKRTKNHSNTIDWPILESKYSISDKTLNKNANQHYPQSDKALLPPQTKKHEGRKTIAIDLDETLVHSSLTFTRQADIVLKLCENNIELTVYVNVRPKAKQLLRKLCEYYEVVIFTASLCEYAEPVIDLLDPEKQTLRLFRDSCTWRDGHYVKDLSKLGRDIQHVLLIDNSQECAELQPENGILVSTWEDNKNDCELLLLKEVLLSRVFLNSENFPETLKAIVSCTNN